MSTHHLCRLLPSVCSHVHFTEVQCLERGVLPSSQVRFHDILLKPLQGELRVAACAVMKMIALDRESNKRVRVTSVWGWHMALRANVIFSLLDWFSEPFLSAFPFMFRGCDEDTFPSGKPVGVLLPPNTFRMPHADGDASEIHLHLWYLFVSK